MCAHAIARAAGAGLGRYTDSQACLQGRQGRSARRPSSRSSSSRVTASGCCSVCQMAIMLAESPPSLSTRAAAFDTASDSSVTRRCTSDSLSGVQVHRLFRGRTDLCFSYHFKRDSRNNTSWCSRTSFSRSASASSSLSSSDSACQRASSAASRACSSAMRCCSARSRSCRQWRRD